MTLPLTTLAHLSERLQELHARTRETPLFNPVFQLGLDLSRALEGGVMDLDALEVLVGEMECTGLKARAARLERLLAPVAPDANRAALAETLARGVGFDAFAKRWETPYLHAVFTAHPTFLLTPAHTAAVAEAASQGQAITPASCGGSEARPAITLEYEHDEAMKAIANAQDARSQIVREALTHAAATWPEQWHALQPLPFRFATWVGYDMDGRTDITWATSLRFRLSEKAERLERYAAQLAALDAGHALIATLSAAIEIRNGSVSARPGTSLAIRNSPPANRIRSRPESPA